MEKFLTTGQAKKIDEKLTKLEEDTGYKFRVSCFVASVMEHASAHDANALPSDTVHKNVCASVHQSEPKKKQSHLEW